MDLVNWFSYSGRCIYCNPLLNVSYWYVYIYNIVILWIYINYIFLLLKHCSLSCVPL